MGAGIPNVLPAVTSVCEKSVLHPAVTSVCEN